jgi:diaminopimelate decarboxylase
LHLEIEPGTFLVANASSLVTTIQDMSDTGPDGYRFLKLDCGMDGILRPSLYGAQHPMIVVNDSARSRDYVVVGHCCEAGDLLTPSPDDSENLEPRLLREAAIGDRLVIEGVGAYCAPMSAHGYNSFPVPREIMRREDGGFVQV